nr:hypothetical protein [Tanacetum cinerariifolium]
MESLSPQVVSAAKLPILNPNEFDLWKMRIKQYFLMTDYSLWEVILNGDSPVPTRVIDGVLQPVAPTTAEQRLARKNELKPRGTLLMALPDKYQWMFNTHKDARTLMEAIEKRFGGNTKTKKVQKTLLKQQYENFTGSSSESLDQIHDRLQKLISQLEILGVSLSQEDINLNLKIYEAEVKSSSSAGTSTQNIAFVSSSNTDNTNKPISVVANNEDLEQIDADDLEKIEFKWQMAMWTVRARRFLYRTGRNLGANGPTSIGFDMSKVECYNCHRKGHFAREERTCHELSATIPSEDPYEEAAQQLLEQAPRSPEYVPDPIELEDHVPLHILEHPEDLVPAEDEAPIEAYILRDNALVVLRQNLKKAEQERDDLQLKLEKFQTSSKNISELLASQTNDKTCLGYNSQVFTRTMFDCYDYLFSGSDESLPPSPIYDRYQSGNGYHAVPPTYTGTFMRPKPDLVYNNAPNDVETGHPTFNVKLSPTNPDNDLSHTHRPSTPIIEDWVSDSEDGYETKTPQNVPSFVQPTTQVKSPRPSVKYVETFIPTANFKITIPKPTRNGKRKNRKACVVCKSLDHLIKDCDYHEKKMAQTIARNHANRRSHKQYASMTLPNPQRHVAPAAVLT